MLYVPMIVSSCVLAARMTTVACDSEPLRLFVRAVTVKEPSSLRAAETRFAPEYTCHFTSESTYSSSVVKLKVTLLLLR